MGSASALTEPSLRAAKYGSHIGRYSCCRVCLRSASRTTIQRTGWRLPPCGPNRAASKARRSTSSGTGTGAKYRQVPVVRMASVRSIDDP